MGYEEEIKAIAEKISETVKVLKKYPDDPILRAALAQDIGMAADVFSDWIASMAYPAIDKSEAIGRLRDSLDGKMRGGIRNGDVVEAEGKEYVAVSHAPYGEMWAVVRDWRDDGGRIDIRRFPVEKLRYVSPPEPEDIKLCFAVKKAMYETYTWRYEEKRKDSVLLSEKLREWEIL